MECVISPITMVEHQGKLYVRERASYGKQIGLQAVMQLVVKAVPDRAIDVHVLFSTYNGKPLKRVYRIMNGLYAPVGRQVTNWRDATGKKVPESMGAVTRVTV